MKKSVFVIALLCALFIAPFAALAVDDGFQSEVIGLNGAVGGYIQGQGGIDLYLENAAIEIGSIAASADIVYVQAAGQVQAMGAYAPSVETYEYHQNYDNYYGYYNDYDQYHNYVEPTLMNISAVQVYEKTTVIPTGYGELIMQQGGMQAGSISITVGNNYGQCN